ncbi:hypothetical protein ABZZ20_03670 [Streptomyces sp. NPDC006430]
MNTVRPELRLITCGGEITDGHRPDHIIRTPIWWADPPRRHGEAESAP